ncbi:hypothetical protein D3C78_1554030 [compost metagenome]
MYSDSSLAACPGTALSTSAGKFSGRSSTSALKRSTRNSMDWRSASVSPTLETNRVSSRRINGAPASTICPSLTNSSATMPPSRFWIFWILDEGIALPSPLVTSSITAKLAHNIRNTKKPMMPQIVSRTTRGASSISALLTSGSGWPCSESEPLK